jgi:nitrobindin-like protein
LHAETGYLRLAPRGHVELVLAHPNGLVEVSEGTVSGTELELHSRLVGRTSTAKEVTALSRHVQVEGDELRYTLAMAAVGRGDTEHLHACLRRRRAEGRT